MLANKVRIYFAQIYTKKRVMMHKIDEDKNKDNNQDQQQSTTKLEYIR